MNTHRIEADVYRKLHERREDHIELARRAREYQLELECLKGASFRFGDIVLMAACVAAWVWTLVIAATSVVCSW